MVFCGLSMMELWVFRLSGLMRDGCCEIPSHFAVCESGIFAEIVFAGTARME